MVSKTTSIDSPKIQRIFLGFSKKCKILRKKIAGTLFFQGFQLFLYYQFRYPNASHASSVNWAAAIIMAKSPRRIIITMAPLS